MVSIIGNGDIIGKIWVLSTVAVHTSYLVSGCGRKPWVTMDLAVIVMVLCVHTNFNAVAGLRVYLLFFLVRAMEVFIGNKSWLRWSRAVRDSPGFFSGVLALDYILRELVFISVLLLIGGSYVLPLWLELKFSEPFISLLSCSGPFLLVLYCIRRFQQISGV